MADVEDEVDEERERDRERERERQRQRDPDSQVERLVLIMPVHNSKVHLELEILMEQALQAGSQATCSESQAAHSVT